jgi:hypothetical protein
MKRRQPFASLEKALNELEMKTTETTHEFMRAGGAKAASWPPSGREGAQKEKKALGVGASL